MTYTIKDAKEAALDMAKDSMERGCLFSSKDMPDEQAHDWSKGDPESLSTIARCAVTDGVDHMDLEDAADSVFNYLCVSFPSLPNETL